MREGATPNGCCVSRVLVGAFLLLEACFRLFRTQHNLLRRHVAAVLAFRLRYNVGVPKYLGKA